MLEQIYKQKSPRILRRDYQLIKNSKKPNLLVDYKHYLRHKKFTSN